MLIDVRSAGHSSEVAAYADSVLIWDESTYGMGNTVGRRIMAMSIAGPEQSVRAIGAGCCVAQDQRSQLRFSQVLRLGQARRAAHGYWYGGWNVMAHMIAPNTMHMIAVSKPPLSETGEMPYQLVVPAAPTEDALDEAIYRTLLANHSTPLLPLESPGQPEWEAEAAKKWCKVIGEAVRGRWSWWRSLLNFYAGADKADGGINRWEGAGILLIDTASLDSLVSDLVRIRRLTLPKEPALA